MIFIITGRQGEGKTTWVLDLHRILRREFIQSGGICSIGTWKEGNRDQFFVMDLENGQSSLLCDRVNSGNDLPFHHFFFKSSGLAFGNQALLRTKLTHPEVAIIDEIGGLELQGNGWSSFLDTFAKRRTPITVMVLRESLVQLVVERWKLKDYHVINIHDWSPLQISQRIKQELVREIRITHPPLTGIILAGGKSSRLGSDKGFIRYRGQFLINIAISRFGQLCSNILISSNTEDYSDLGYQVVPDKVNDCGPMMGIYSCLLESSTALNIVAPVDSPLLPTGLYLEMLRIRKGYQVVVPDQGNGQYEPVIGMYTRDLVESMEELFNRDIYSLPALFKKVRFKGLKVGRNYPFSNPMVFANINTPGDLEYLESLEDNTWAR